MAALLGNRRRSLVRWMPRRSFEAKYRPTSKSILTAVLPAVIGLSVLFSAIASAQPTSNSGPKPTVVLVHGAWADASSWNGVVQRLQRDGSTVLAPPNALRGVASETAYLSSFLDTVSGPIVWSGTHLAVS